MPSRLRTGAKQSVLARIERNCVIRSRAAKGAWWNLRAGSLIAISMRSREGGFRRPRIRRMSISGSSSTHCSRCWPGLLSWRYCERSCPGRIQPGLWWISSVFALALLLIQFHCLDCGATGWLFRYQQHACPRVVARWQNQVVRRFHGPRLRIQLIAWFIVTAAAFVQARLRLDHPDERGVANAIRTLPAPPSWKIRLDDLARVRYRYDIEYVFLKGRTSQCLMVLVRDVDENALARLKQKAKSNGRSLGVELKLILEQAAKQFDMVTAREMAVRMSRRLEGRHHTDSAELLREDRDR